jgi:hypothetical protein
MKNIHVLPTDKPSRLFKFANQLHLDTIPKDYYKKYNIYITSDEEIKVNEYYLGDDNNIYNLTTSVNSNGKKIVLTTNTELIEEGIQSIDDEFLEWFVNNPSCESVVVNFNYKKFRWSELNKSQCYKIIIPQEEPKQETRVFGTKDDESFWSDKPKQGKLTTEPINKTKHKVIFNNKRHIGYFIMDIDGYYYFDSLIKSNGWWTSYSLRMVADLLDTMNKSYEHKLNQELSN